MQACVYAVSRAAPSSPSSPSKFPPPPSELSVLLLRARRPLSTAAASPRAAGGVVAAATGCPASTATGLSPAACYNNEGGRYLMVTDKPLRPRSCCCLLVATWCQPRHNEPDRRRPWCSQQAGHDANGMLEKAKKGPFVVSSAAVLVCCHGPRLNLHNLQRARPSTQLTLTFVSARATYI